MLHSLILAALLLLAPGCASHHYAHVDKGVLHGKLIVQWIDYDKFIFLPHEKEPLTFVRHNKESITPGQMYTDGGSIPRPLWAVRNYSPWGYAPAFIIHDWLFAIHHCQLPGYGEYDVNKAALIMSEVTKTLMEDPKHGGKNELVLFSMYETVRSPVAEKLWREGRCNLPILQNLLRSKKKPLLEYVIEFP